MKKQKLDLKLNHPVNFRTNEDLYAKFTFKCAETGQFNQDRINLLIASDLGISIPFKTNPANQSLFEDTEVSPEHASA